MQPNEWAAVAVAITTLVAAFAGATRWMVKHYLSELKPNGGGSMRDAVNTNSERLTRVENRVDKIYEILCEKNS